MKTRWELIREQEKRTRKALKSCTMARQYKGFGFDEPIVNGNGQCSGCRNPDDGELEWYCCTCCHNEYFVGEAAT